MTRFRGEDKLKTRGGNASLSLAELGGFDRLIDDFEEEDWW